MPGAGLIEEGVNLTGYLNAPNPTNIPHPTIVPLGVPGRNRMRYIAVTFNGARTMRTTSATTRRTSRGGPAASHSLRMFGIVGKRVSMWGVGGQEQISAFASCKGIVAWYCSRQGWDRGSLYGRRYRRVFAPGPGFRDGNLSAGYGYG